MFNIILGKPVVRELQLHGAKEIIGSLPERTTVDGSATQVDAAWKGSLSGEVSSRRMQLTFLPPEQPVGFEEAGLLRITVDINGNRQTRDIQYKRSVVPALSCSPSRVLAVVHPKLDEVVVPVRMHSSDSAGAVVQQAYFEDGQNVVLRSSIEEDTVFLCFSGWAGGSDTASIVLNVVTASGAKTRVPVIVHRVANEHVVGDSR